MSRSLSLVDAAGAAPPPPGRPAPAEAACAAAATTLLPLDQAERLADLFRALADPTRVRLLAHIAGAEHGTTCACHLPASLGISQPTLSHHLRKLTEAGLITREQRGRWAHYTAVPGVLELARDFLGASTDAARC
nr:helix-turn-helix transcriptional regulator [Propionibacterium sp.]